MARPPKIGLDYFPLNSNIESNDKIQLIEAEFGSKGFAIVIKLFCKIYAEKGYYYNWTEVEKLLFAKRMGESVGLVDEIVKRSVKWGLFDEPVFNQFQILTSSGIQSRFLEAASRRENIEIFKEILLLDISDYKNKVNVNINSINADSSTQSKVNKSKVKNNIVISPPKGEANPNEKSFKLFSEQEFYDSLKPYVKDYSKQTVRDFYDYWKEPSPSGKMRFQLEKTWSPKGRLSTWKRNEPKFGTSTPVKDKTEQPVISGPWAS